MRVTVLAGGIGGARFLRGLLSVLPAPEHSVTVIGNTGDDIWLHGLRVCPDLDTVMYTLGGGISEEQGWGRAGESFVVKDELGAYGRGPDWFGLGDRDLATHIVRTDLLRSGRPLSEVTRLLCARWQPGVDLLPMSDDEAQTHVRIVDPATGDQATIHFEEWWVRYRAGIPALGFTMVGADDPAPAPGVVEALQTADLVILPPSNPIVSIGAILHVRAIDSAVRTTPAPVIGLSPIVGGAPVRGMADACLTALGIETSARAVADHYGARRDGGLLDGWLVDTADAHAVDAVRDLGIDCHAVPLLMTDVAAAGQMATEAIALGRQVGSRRTGRA